MMVCSFITLLEHFSLVQRLKSGTLAIVRLVLSYLLVQYEESVENKQF